MIRATFLIALPFAMGAMCASASESNPLGPYLGGGVGHADVRSTVRTAPAYEFEESAAGWKAVIGVRPIRTLAAELEYLDFGHAHSTSSMGFFISDSNALQRATSLSGLVYLPIPLPVLDIYGRAGVARLRSSGGNQLVCHTTGPCTFLIIPPSSFNRTDTDLLYGAGVQANLPAVAVRLEYERINDHYGDPDMMSLGLTWTF